MRQNKHGNKLKQLQKSKYFVIFIMNIYLSSYAKPYNILWGRNFECVSWTMEGP